MAHKNKMIRCELVNHYDIASQAALVVKNLPASAGETRLWFSGRSPGEGKGYLLQYSGLENSMDCIVHGIAKSQTRLSDFYIHSLSTMWQYLSKCKIHKAFDQKFHF